MQCTILVNTMNPRSTFLQTLLGLVCYSHGLRDQGFKILNSFGVISSIFHIRQHGRLWAKARSFISELNPKRFWRATFDNLDFRLKFKKTLSVGGDCCSSLNRMLHLLTSQVSFTIESDSPYIKPDAVVYTTVDEGYSGSLDDVGKYLSRLKADLKMGQTGNPTYVVLAGDQQTYAHMTNLKIKYPGYYHWFYTVPGDWHIMKNTAEVIQYVIMDGGFHTFS